MNIKIGNPVKEFKTEEEAQRMCKWWMVKLGITDWIIKVKIVPFNGDILKSKDMGLCDADYINGVAYIYLASLNTLPEGESVFDVYMENTLVHELLHIIYPVFENSSDTYTSASLALYEHRKLEKMARALISAKYDIDPCKFYNKIIKEE